MLQIKLGVTTPLEFEEEVDKMVRVEGVNDAGEDESEEVEAFSMEDENSGTDAGVNESEEGVTTEI